MISAVTGVSAASDKTALVRVNATPRATALSSVTTPSGVSCNKLTITWYDAHHEATRSGFVGVCRPA